MHKHQTKRQGGSDRFKNSNLVLSESVKCLIRDFKVPESGDFASEYLNSSFLSKFCSEDVVKASVRKDAAIQKWIDTESTNRETNSRLRGTDRGFNILPRVTWSRFLSVAQRTIAEILGPLTDEITLGSFSGGASTSRKRGMSSPAHKYVGKADTTEAALQFVDIIHRTAPLLKQARLFYDTNVVAGAVLFTVPKKTDIDRCACKEPDINMFLQKGVGQHIRKRLRRFGVDLNDQQINKRFAYRGSLDGSLATIDLSAASDSVVISTVLALLPLEWFQYLNDIRSQVVIVEGTPVITEMFSSMGNGFTFELESLIFYALMRTTAYFEGVSGTISVYGDDIIIPSSLYESAEWVLSYFGFSVNMDKSFHNGPFRESCGGHYHLGEDVTPFYLKRDPTHLTDLIRVANQFRQWCFASPGRAFNPELYHLWLKFAQNVPVEYWGGRDYALDTQLVAPVPSRSRLVRVTRSKNPPADGAYLAWHAHAWNRTNAPLTGVQPPSDTLKVCRRKRATQGALYLADQFFEELVDQANS